MTMWRVSSKSEAGRWVQSDGAGGWTADDVTSEYIEAGLGQPVSRGAIAEVYTPGSKTDPVGLYLLALDVVPGPHAESGAPPEVPAPEPAAEGRRVN